MNGQERQFARWWDLPAASLLVVAVLTAVNRLIVTDWTTDLGLVQNIAILGLIAGFALGYSRFSSRVVLFFATVYGLFVVPWQIGRTLGEGILWSERMLSLTGRLEVIIGQLVNQEIVQDSLLFLVMMAILFWVLSVQAAYTLVRHGNAWQAILPTGLALFVLHSFDALIARRAWYLAIFIFFTLVLVARMAYLQRYSEWRSSRTALPPHLGLDFIRFALMATALVVLLAWTVPALADSLPAAEKAFQPVRYTWNRVRDRFDNAFAGLRATVGVVGDHYGDSVLLGRGNQLTDTEVLYVDPPDDAPTSVRYYWRARTYDTYRNGQWLSTNAKVSSFNPQQDNLELPDEEGRFLGTFNILAASNVSTLYTPPQPLWVSRPADLEAYSYAPDGVDLSSFRAASLLRPGEVYQVQSYVTNATVAQMRAAGVNYPEWVRDRYLQLPDSITPRTRELAAQITAGLETPYDKVMAITNYLRSNIEYSETIPEIPSNREPVDWFLFDLRQGFCNYYASSEVVMLRSLGIPARWSVGFARGEVMEDGVYVVRQRDAHAWPEVYFPGLGWIEFEPTASQPVLVRRAGDNNPLEDRERNLPPDAQDQRNNLDEVLQDELNMLRAEEGLNLPEGDQASTGAQRWRMVAIWGGSLTLAAGALALAWRNRNRYNFNRVPLVMERTMLRFGLRPPKFLDNWARQASLSPLARSYNEINQALNRLGQPAEVDATPNERAQRLSGALPPTEDPANRLVSAYQLANFSPQPQAVDLESASKDSGEIRWLSYKAWFKNLFARFQQPDQDRRPWWKRS